MDRPRPVIAACLAFLLGVIAPASTARAVPPPSAAAAQSGATPLILLSLDGVRAEYLERGLTPALRRFARRGVRAEAMRPSYPSMTFPNHYTLVTGLRPDRHGIVENTMRDARLGRFAMHDRRAVQDGRWWGGEPLWVTLQHHGGRAAAMFWPGTEAAIDGVRPWQWRPFSYDFAPEARVAQVLDWLRMPPSERPRFVMLYFEHVDRAGHAFGPDSPEVAEALQTVDRLVARLLQGLARAGVAANVVIVSDHGMSRIGAQRIQWIEDQVPLADIDLWDFGATAQLAARPGREAAVEAAVLGRRGHMQCWRKQEVPARWHYGAHPRIAPIVCQADPGWILLTRAEFERFRDHVHRGSHGYDPAHPDMAAIFLAQGPAFARGKVLPAFDNVHVYPLLARLLGVPAAPNDGDASVLAGALRGTEQAQ